MSEQNEYRELEYKIRDILDRNSFASQKIDLNKIKLPPGAPPIQDAFRIRVMQPLRFAVEIVKPKPMQDFLFVIGKLNISPEHQKLIAELSLNKQLDLIDELRLELSRSPPNTKFQANPQSKILQAIECMQAIIITHDDDQFMKDLFTAMENVNKTFFTVIIVLQHFLRKAGLKPSPTHDTEGSTPFYQ